MLEVDDIIAQNSTTAIEPSTTVEEATPPISGGLNTENKNIDENIKNQAFIHENMEGIVDREEVFEQNIKDTEIYLNDATNLETVTDGSEKEGDIELNDKKDNTLLTQS